MRTLFLLLSILCFTTCIAQGNKRINITSGLQRCLDGSGDPIENCWTHTNSNGKLVYISGEDAAILLSAANEGAVDSIYVSGDTMYVVYFNAPTLAYKASMPNGLYTASNNNTNIKVNTIIYPVAPLSTLLTFQKANGTNKVQFNNACPITTYAESVAGIAQSSYGNATLNCLTRLNAGLPTGKPAWDYGILSGSQFIVRCNKNQTKNLFTIDTVLTAAITNTLRIYGNGDIGMANYGSARTLSTGISNVAFWDASGVLQKSSLSVLKDSLNISTSNMANANLNVTANRTQNFVGHDFTFKNLRDGIFSIRQRDTEDSSYVRIAKDDFHVYQFKDNGSDSYADLILNNNATPYFQLSTDDGTGNGSNISCQYGTATIDNGESAIQLSNADISYLGNLIIEQRTPSSASDTGVAGTITRDANYIYICVATDTWKRVAISTW